jgi:drug/metabolite transporter (DMT)-like permease
MPRGWRAWTPFFVMGLFNSLIPNSLIFWGQTQISASLASILNATTPLWTVILAHFFTTDERLTPNRLVGVLIGLLGVAVMIGPAALQGIGLNVLAQFAVITAAMSYAIATIYGKRLRATPPFIASAGQLTASTVLLIPFVVLVDRPWTLPSPSGSTIAAVLALALLSTALAYILYFRILRSSGATNIALVTFLIPVSAMILGTVLLNERLEPRDFVGMALIGTGLAAIDGRLIRRFLPARPPVETVPEEVAP